MKVIVSNIIYCENTREWNITMDKLKGYIDYRNNPRADQSIWSFGNMMEMGADTPTEFTLEAPFENFIDNIDEIDTYVKQVIKEKTTRDAKSLSLKEVK